jgi:hypothetical protein
MKGHVDLLGPASNTRRVNGNTFFDAPDYSELFAEEKEMIGKLKAFLMVAERAIQNTDQI